MVKSFKKNINKNTKENNIWLHVMCGLWRIWCVIWGPIQNAWLFRFLLKMKSNSQEPALCRNQVQNVFDLTPHGFPANIVFTYHDPRLLADQHCRTKSPDDSLRSPRFYTISRMLVRANILTDLYIAFHWYPTSTQLQQMHLYHCTGLTGKLCAQWNMFPCGAIWFPLGHYKMWREAQAVKHDVTIKRWQYDTGSL